MSAERLNTLMLDDVHLTGAYYDGSRLVPWGTTLSNALLRPDLAAECFRRRTGAAPTDVVAWRNLGWAQYETGNAAAAAWALEAGLKIDSSRTDIMGYLGYARMMERDWDAAARAFERCVANDPDNVEALFGGGVARAYCGADSAASEFLARAIAINVAERVSSKLSDKDSLIAYTQNLALAYKESRLILPRIILISQLHLLGGSAGTAVRAAEVAAEHAPDSPVARRQLALCMSAMHATEEALVEWKTYRAQRPDDPFALFVMGVLAGKAGDDDLAIECLEQAVELAPFMASPCLELAEVYSQRGDPDGARRWMEEYRRRSE
jgi:tetratricopeptide (TPR) repeat protein